MKKPLPSRPDSSKPVCPRILGPLTTGEPIRELFG